MNKKLNIIWTENTGNFALPVHSTKGIKHGSMGSERKSVKQMFQLCRKFEKSYLIWFEAFTLHSMFPESQHTILKAY